MSNVDKDQPTNQLTDEYISICLEKIKEFENGTVIKLTQLTPEQRKHESNEERRCRGEQLKLLDYTAVFLAFAKALWGERQALRAKLEAKDKRIKELEGEIAGINWICRLGIVFKDCPVDIDHPACKHHNFLKKGTCEKDGGYCKCHRVNRTKPNRLREIKGSNGAEKLS